MLSLVLRALRKLCFWGHWLFPMPSVLGAEVQTGILLAVLRGGGEPGLKPGRYLYRQPVRSVSTWKCDSLPKWLWFNIPYPFLLLSVFACSFQQLCKRSWAGS